jgi:hypothetical protein
MHCGRPHFRNIRPRVQSVCVCLRAGVAPEVRLRRYVCRGRAVSAPRMRGMKIFRGWILRLAILRARRPEFIVRLVRVRAGV